MPRAGVEILSPRSYLTICRDHRGNGDVMPIRVLRSRHHHGFMNVLMNPNRDESWCDILEAYDISVSDLLKGMKRLGLIKAYLLPSKPKRYDCDKSWETPRIDEGFKKVLPFWDAIRKRWKRAVKRKKAKA